MKDKIGIVGFGNMGSAIAKQIKSKYQIWVFDKDENKTKNLSGINITKNVVDLVNKVDTVILAVKPQDFDAVLNGIKNYVKGKLIISIAAGITTNYIEKKLGNVRLIRIMPNMPARIGEGMSCLCKGRLATMADLDFSKDLFHCLGNILVIEEDMMDAACAISGSGPGYLYYLIEGRSIEEAKEYTKNVFIPSLTQAAESIGFNHEDALLLAATTGNSSVSLLIKTGLTAQELKKQITSKGGTTEAALEVLHKGGYLKDAVKAALKRSEELAKRE